MAKQSVQVEAQDGPEADAIRGKELINVGGMAWVFSAGSQVNGRIILPDATKDQLELKNAHVYRHATLGDFVAFAIDYQVIGGDTLERQGWELHPYLRPDDATLGVKFDGTIVRYEDEDDEETDDDADEETDADADDEDDEEDDEDEVAPTVVGKRADLQLVGPAPVCFNCEQVHAAGPEAAHETKRAHIKAKLDGMLGQGWDEDLDEDDGDEVEESADGHAHVRAEPVSCAKCGDAYRPDSPEADRHQIVAEYQIMTMPHDRTPNWDAGRAHIDGLERTPVSAWPGASSFAGPSDEPLRSSGLASREAFWAARLRTALRNVQLVWGRKSLHFNRIDKVRDADLLVTGGYLTECVVEKRGTGAMAWVSMLEASGVSRTVGFDD